MSQVDKERDRRAAIEAAYAKPKAPDPKHPTRDDERPLTAGRIRAALRDRFEIQEFSATVFDHPRWKTVNPDDPHLSYVSDPVTVYHLGAIRECAIGELKAVEVMMIDDKWTRSRIATLRTLDRGSWINKPPAGLAKIIRELLA